MKNFRHSQGFSLIELMIVVVIIALLAAFAVPAYSDYVMRARIPDATSALANKRIQAEQFFQDNRRYDDGAWGNNRACAVEIGTTFDFSCSVQTQNTYTIQAVGKGRMSGFSYTIDQNNARQTTVVAPAPNGWQSPAVNCWITNKGGAC